MGLLCIAVTFNAVSRKNEGLLSVLSEEMMKADINNPLRISHFLSQMSHESAGFTVLQENLNYSEQGLIKTFPRYFKGGLEKRYARKPILIASRVYANRMGNGSEDTQEGWFYRGRGIIQLTFKANYSKYSQLIFGDDRLVKNPDLALELRIACKVACTFWNENKLNELADKDDIHGITRIINGGLNGLAHRKELLDKAKKMIGI